MNSIRARLTARLVAGSVVLLLACGALLHVYVRHALLKQFDVALFARAEAFIAMSEQEPGTERPVSLQDLPPNVQAAILEHAAGYPVREIDEAIRDDGTFYKAEFVRDGAEFEIVVSGDGKYVGTGAEFEFAFAALQSPEFQPGPDAEYFEVWDEDGERLVRSPSLAENELPLPSPREGRPSYSDVTLPDGINGRVVTRSFAPLMEVVGPDGVETMAPGEPLVLSMARSRAELDWALGVVLSGLVCTGALLILCTVLLVRSAVHGSLEPLRTVAEQSSGIGAESLGYRFSVGDAPVELRPIVYRLNDLLERLEGAFQRERRFTSDVAHELRTPIAELRSLAEVGLREFAPESKESGHAVYFEDTLAIALQMERLVTALLAISRSHTGVQAVERPTLDPVALVRSAWKPLEQHSSARALQVDFTVPAEAKAKSDPELLSAILTNLLSNAVSYTPPGGRVSVEISGGDGCMVLSVINYTTDLDESDLPHMLEPFWRKDKARSDSSHSGVGLAVVAELSTLLGIGLTVDMPSAGLFRVSLRLPE